MKTKNQAPEAQSESAGARFIIHYKGRQISLSKLQTSAFILISNGKRHSSNRINRVCKTSCARDLVIQLIDKGINVQKCVVDATPTIPRHKLYWIDPKECREEADDE